MCLAQPRPQSLPNIQLPCSNSPSVRAKGAGLDCLDLILGPGLSPTRAPPAALLHTPALCPLSPKALVCVLGTSFLCALVLWANGILRASLSGFVFTLMQVPPSASVQGKGRTVELSRGLAVHARPAARGYSAAPPAGCIPDSPLGRSQGFHQIVAPP